MASNDRSLSGKIAVVTGATSGIGKEIARGLAHRGATLIIGARSAERGAALGKELAAESGNDQVTVQPLDVADPGSIRAFAAGFRKQHPQLHLLINNAGAWYSDRHDAANGHELTFATNVLGPHLLTQLLLDPLRAGAPSRIVNLVSTIAGNLDAGDLDFRTRKYDGFKVYGQSKQALRMLTWGLAKRLEGSGVTANAASPGFVKTNFNQNAHGFVASMINFSAKLFAATPEKGADTPLWVATAPELATVSGKMFDARKEKECKFRDPAAIADLERRCDEMLAAASGARAA